MISEDSWEEIKSRLEDYRNIRGQFHQIPELAFEEYKTTDAICQYLEGIHVTPHRLESTGVTAYIGPAGAPTIALRADIDALAVTEETGLSCTSLHEGKMHACGHDGHITGLLGAATYLKERETDLDVRVKLIFQPAEENSKGAKSLIDHGVLEGVDAVFGLHVFSDIPCGTVSIEPGPRMAQTDRFVITFTGRGGHAAKPHLCIDATLMAAQFVVMAQTIVSRQINPVDGAVLTIGSLHSGTQYNVISPEAVLKGTCRSYAVENAQKLREGIEKRARAVAEIYGGEVQIDYVYGAHPPVINHEGFSHEILSTAREFMPELNYSKLPPIMLGDDFAWYQQEVPGVYAFVGCGRESGEAYPNHHPKFDIEESALCHAVGLHLSAVEAFSQNLQKVKKVIDR